MKRRSLHLALCVSLLVACRVCIAAETATPPVSPLPTVILGRALPEAEKHNVEFQHFGDGMRPLYDKNNLKVTLFEYLDLFMNDKSEDQIYAMLAQHHVVHFGTTLHGVGLMDAAKEARARVVGAAIARYVRDGGGVFLEPHPVRYPTMQEDVYWNIVLEPLGVKLLTDTVFDPTRTYEGTTLGKATFWYTNNIVAHPVTQGVSRLYLPLISESGTPGILGIQYSSDWQVIVRGEEQAKSFLTPADLQVNTEHVGFYKSQPPVVAVRTLGKGRIVCYPISALFTGQDYGNPLWAHVVETEGDRGGGHPSDSMRMQINAYRWLAEPALGVPTLGTYRETPYKPAEFPASANLDAMKFGVPPDRNPVFPDGQKTMTAPPATGLRGVMGAHTSYTDGTGAVEDYVRAAKAAGLSFIVFNDPLEKLTPANFDKLKADCAAASSDSFYACPGIEFTDGMDVRWAMWGFRTIFPVSSFKDVNRTYVQWDGKRVNFFGQYCNATGQPGCMILDYKQLRANGGHPENLWWFFHYAPLVFEKDKLIADNYSEFLLGLRDLRWGTVASYTRMRDPADVAPAAAAFFTSFPDMASVKAGLNTYASTYGNSWWPGYFVSQGPTIAAWEAINPQLEFNWQQTRGAQRTRLHFNVHSDAGIADVKVHDADMAIVRRFDGAGAKDLDRQFEVVNDKQHYLTLEVTDAAGKRAFSQYYFIYSYKQGLFRCGDNLNILGATGMIWHPDRNQLLPIARDFHNGWQYGIVGWDTGTPLVPSPTASPMNVINIKGVGQYPQYPAVNAMGEAVMDLSLGSCNFQIVSMRLDRLAERMNTVERPQPAFGSVPKDLGENEYFERLDTIYSPADRNDWYTAWNFRRPIEGRRDYKGGLIWHEGSIKFKKDVVLQGDVPIPLLTMNCPVNLDRRWGDLVVARDAKGVTHVDQLQDVKSPLKVGGKLGAGSYLSIMPALVGYQGLFVPPGVEMSYVGSVPGGIMIGLGSPGQEIKAGTILKYRYAFASLANPKSTGNAILEHTSNALNMSGGHDGYPVQMKVGKLEDATFFLTALADRNEASFKLGPQELTIDLPLRINGLDDNGCVAAYTTRRPWFRFVSAVDHTAYFQEPIDQENQVWVGNPFVCDDKTVRLDLVVDGQAEGSKPKLEVHNPGTSAVSSKLWSPPNTPLFGGIAVQVSIPAGQSLWFTIDGQNLVPLK